MYIDIYMQIFKIPSFAQGQTSPNIIVLLGKMFLIKFNGLFC